MPELDAATVLLQWATGGLLFLWVTTRRREVGIGYGWLLRSVYGVMAIGAVALGFGAGLSGTVAVLTTAALVVSAGVALAVSVVRRKAGVAGERARRERRTARVAAMTGIDRQADAPAEDRPEFPPLLDLLAPAFGAIALFAVALGQDGPTAVNMMRAFAGAWFLGSVSDAMLLGHWYLVQPGLDREPIRELNRWFAASWPVEVVALLVPTGMFSVLAGSIDDGYGGLLGWFWIACALTTIILAGVTHLALKEREYSAVMAATGLLYLAILTAFGTDLVARAVLS